MKCQNLEDILTPLKLREILLLNISENKTRWLFLWILKQLVMNDGLVSLQILNSKNIISAM